MAASTSDDLWLCYRHCMDLRLATHDPHTTNLARADARACLDLWFEAVERDLWQERTALPSTGRPEFSRT